MPQELTTRSVINALAGISSAILAWVFMGVMWPAVEKVPVLDERISSLEKATSQNASDIRSLIVGSRAMQSTLYHYTFYDIRRGNIVNSARYNNTCGSAIDSIGDGLNYLHIYNYTNECAERDPDWRRTNTGSLDKLLTTFKHGKRMGCPDNDRNSIYVDAIRSSKINL